MRRSTVHSRRTRAVLGRLFLRAWVLVLVALLVVPEVAQAQESCDNALTEANTHFSFGRFDEAITLLDACLEQDAFSDEQQRQAYEVLAQVYEANGQQQEARTALAALLTLNPGYEPDPEFPSSFRDLVEAVKGELAAAAEPEEPPVEAPPPGPVVQVTVASVYGEAVRNVQIRQEGDWLVVTYDLVGTAKKYEVRLLLSTDGGRSFEALPQTVTGEVGQGMLPGGGKEMRWAVLQDFPEGLAGDLYRVQVTAQKQGGGALLYILGAVVAGGGATAALLLGGGGGDDGGNGNGGNGNGGNGNGGPDPIPVPPGRPPGN